MLGGSSGLNMLAWTRATESEYDSWGALVQSSEWSWSAMLPFFTKSTAVPPQTSLPDVTQAAFDPLLEGFVGPVTVRRDNNLECCQYSKGV